MPVTISIVALLISVVGTSLAGLTFYRNYLYERDDLTAFVLGADPPSGVLDRSKDRAILVALVNGGNRNAVLVAGRLVFWNFAGPGWGTFISRTETAPEGNWPEDFSPWLDERGLVVEPHQTKVVRVRLPRQGPLRRIYQNRYWSSDQMIAGVALRTASGAGQSFVTRFQIGVLGADQSLHTEWFDNVSPSRTVRQPLLKEGDVPLFADGNIDTILKRGSFLVATGTRLSQSIEHAAVDANGRGEVRVRMTMDPGP